MGTLNHSEAWRQSRRTGASHTSAGASRAVGRNESCGENISGETLEKTKCVWGGDWCLSLSILTLQPDQEASVQTLGAVTVNLVWDLCSRNFGGERGVSYGVLNSKTSFILLTNEH